MSKSRDAEKKYMEQEIKRAVDAVKENEEETRKLDVKRRELENEMTLKFQNSETSKKELNEKIEIMRKEIKVESGLNKELVGQLSKTMENLESLTISRVRTQNGNTKKKSKTKGQTIYK